MKKQLLAPLFTCLLLACPDGFANSIKVQHWQTNNGAQVFFVSQPDLPMVDISIAFKAGSAFDGQNWGLAAITANMLEQGAANYNATELAEQFENYGAQFSADIDRDKAVFSLRSLSYPESLEHTTHTLGLILSKPSFKAASFEREKVQHITSLRYQSEKPSTIASHAFFSAIYHDHPYGHPVMGTEDKVKTITAAMAKSFFEQHYTANNAIISLVGNLNRTQAKALTDKLSQQLSSTMVKLPAPAKQIKAKTKQQLQKIPFPGTQTNIIIGQIGIDYHSKHLFPLLVGNYTLGGSGLVSKLAEEVREKRGLTYGVYSSFELMAAPGPFTIKLATKGQQAQQALSVTLNTLNQFLKSGPSEEELIAAKQYLNGSFPLKLSSNKSIAATLINIGFYQLPLNFIDGYLDNINQVDTKQIKTAFDATINTKQLLTVMVGN